MFLDFFLYHGSPEIVVPLPAHFISPDLTAAASKIFPQNFKLIRIQIPTRNAITLQKATRPKCRAKIFLHSTLPNSATMLLSNN